jgi:hypothetical protein
MIQDHVEGEQETSYFTNILKFLQQRKYTKANIGMALKGQSAEGVFSLFIPYWNGKKGSKYFFHYAI